MADVEFKSVDSVYIEILERAAGRVFIMLRAGCRVANGLHVECLGRSQLHGIGSSSPSRGLKRDTISLLRAITLLRAI